MRAISTFNRVSTDISDIQHRITTGLRINSGKDDPGGLIIREGLRADIKNIQATQAGMNQAEILMDTAAGGMSQLVEILQGKTDDPTSGMLAMLKSDLAFDKKQAMAEDFIKLYDGVINSTTYNGQQLIGGDLAATGKTYQLGGGQTLNFTIADLSSDKASGGANGIQSTVLTSEGDLPGYMARVEDALTEITTAMGNLGMKQQIAATNQKLLDSRLTSVTASEGRISNADIAAESSRMARSELLAQNAMNSILYTRHYAAFAVSSLFG
jgi:flagellin